MILKHPLGQINFLSRYHLATERMHLKETL